MALSIQQNLKQSQNLVLTPELRQAIEVLQLSAVELDSFINEALESNPLLSKQEDIIHDNDEDKHAHVNEYENNKDEDTTNKNNPQIKDSDNSDNTNNVSEDQELFNKIKAETTTIMDDILSGKLNDMNIDNTDHELIWTEETQTDIKNNTSLEHTTSLNEITSNNYNDIITKSSNSSHSNNDYDFLKDSLAGEKSIYEDIIEQINININQDKREVAYKLLEFMDNTGKLNIEDVQSLYNTYKKSTVDTILSEMQKKITPAGIFSTSIVECLKIQLQNRNKYDPIVENFLNNFHLFVQGNIKKLKKIMNIDDEDFKSVIDDLKDLTVNPLKLVDNAPVITVVSDVIVSYNSKKNKWIAELNSSILPKLLINETYYSEVSNSTTDKKVKKFLNNNLKNGNFLLRSLDQRAKHILDISIAILKLQQDFFKYGTQKLKPLTMRDIAQACSIHESTVSRIVNNKYMSTPYGVFELRYFFNSALNNTSGDAEKSTHVVRERIKSLIEKENITKPLSDDKIVTILMGEGINIARRTVAKYRSSLNIPSSSKRKHYKNIHF